MKQLPTRRDGVETRARLLRIARETFEEKGYHRTSIAEICRRASVANGTFYRYFDGKDEVFLHLAEQLAEGLELAVSEALRGVSGTYDRIHRTLAAFYDYVGRHRALYQIFREAEFVRLELPLRTYHRVARRLEEHLFGAGGGSHGGCHPVVPDIARSAVSFALIGCASMLAAKYIIWEERPVPAEVIDSVADFLAYGLSAETPAPPLSRQALDFIGAAAGLNGAAVVVDDGFDLRAAGLTEGQRTRRKLLQAAEDCFAEMGFFKAQIADITRRAGVAQGTFYVHFPGKIDILRELVQDINRRLRSAIRRGLAEAGLGADADRRHVEIVGLASFLHWLRRREGIYRIVREAEFVDEEVARWYYERLSVGYTAWLRTAMIAGQIRPLPEQTLAYALLGIGHISGVRWVLWPSEEAAQRPADLPPANLPPADLRPTVEALAALILHGVEGVRAGAFRLFDDAA